jgi:hypothetical protein
MLVLGAVVLSVGGGLGASLAANQALATISSVRDLRAFTQLGVLGAISRRLTPAEDRRRRRTNYAFAGGVTGLCTLFGVALGFLLIAMRAG